MSIKILEPDTYTKIAAGEVIQSPVSVLKELIENSIDANAKNIFIEIENAGKSLISVRDDGDGIDKNDLKLVLYRYATSKLSNIEDLKKLSTYGFRGEALFSIFAVSKIKITTNTDKQEHGYTLQAEGGDFSTIVLKPAPPLKGTIVEVRDLFFNTPARFKFLKSDSSIKSSILKLFEEFAIIHYNKSFKITIDQKEVYNLAHTDTMKSRIKEIFDKDIYENIIEINENFGDLTIKGFVSSPLTTLNFKNHHYIYVNRRIIESKLISKAVYKAYGDLFERNPFFIIAIDLDPEKIDVNVHPQKKEIKFEDEYFIYTAVYKTVKKSLENSKPYQSYIIPSKHTVETINQDIQASSHINNQPIEVNDLVYQDLFNSSQDLEKKTSHYKPPIKFIGQAFTSLLIFQTSDSIIILDQHAATERITYEKYLNELKSQKILKYKLLIPVEIKLKKSQIEKILEMKDWLDESGFEIDQTGPSMIRVYSIPHIFDFSKNDIQEIIFELEELVIKPENLSVELKREVIANIACKRSIKFNEVINEEKAISIIENLLKTDDPLCCPHGRPTLIEINSTELLKKFERI